MKKVCACAAVLASFHFRDTGVERTQAEHAGRKELRKYFVIALALPPESSGHRGCTSSS